MVEFFPVRVELGDEVPLATLGSVLAHVKFQVVAVRTDDSFGKAGRFIAVGPVERWFEDNLNGWITLRFVKPCSRLRFTKDICNAVIANSITRPEVRMCVVVKRAPPNAAGILRIGSQLIMDPRVSQGMLSLPFVIIGCLGWKGMSDKLGIKIARMIGFLEWKPEIVHREHLFEELRLLEVPYSTGLTSWIQQVSQGIRAGVETVIVL